MTAPRPGPHQPPGYIGPARTAILLEVIRQHHPTVRSVAHSGARSTRTIQQHLTSLRRAGLVDWVDHHQGTLHATVAPVRFGPTAGRAVMHDLAIYDQDTGELLAGPTVPAP